MRKLDKLRIEITLGFVLMLLSFIISFLLAINVLTFDASFTIYFCFFLYTLSLIGLVLGLFVIYELIIIRRIARSKK